jgi:hypothetical protein
MQYQVTGNIQHDNKAYGPGDTLDLSEAQAKPLIEAGVIEDPNAEPATPEQKATRVKKPKPQATPEQKTPTVGGERSETGEPSIDVRDEGKQTDAKDVTPEQATPEQKDPSEDL